MNTIWKLSLNSDQFRVDANVPIGAKVVHVEEQGAMPTIWFMFPMIDQRKTEVRTFEIFGTEQAIPDEKHEYLGTCKCGVFVWHIFEVKKEETKNEEVIPVPDPSDGVSAGHL